MILHRALNVVHWNRWKISRNSVRITCITWQHREMKYTTYVRTCLSWKFREKRHENLIACHRRRRYIIPGCCPAWDVVRWHIQAFVESFAERDLSGADRAVHWRIPEGKVELVRQDINKLWFMTGFVSWKYMNGSTSLVLTVRKANIRTKQKRVALNRTIFWDGMIIINFLLLCNIISTFFPEQNRPERDDNGGFYLCSLWQLLHYG